MPRRAREGAGSGHWSGEVGAVAETGMAGLPPRVGQEDEASSHADWALMSSSQMAGNSTLGVLVSLFPCLLWGDVAAVPLKDSCKAGYGEGDERQKVHTQVPSKMFSLGV